MKALVFDVDDTLYDQLRPFQQAVAAHFSFPKTQIEALYVAFRKASDALFHQSERGEIAMDAMHAARIQQACQTFEIELSTQQALAFQQSYADFQSQIELTATMKAALDYGVAQQIPLAAITNGPIKHQWRKVQQLGLLNWIPQENIVISAEVGVAKPEKDIFRIVEERLQLAPKEILYIGDSYENDVIGAKNAGWQVMWLNHRQNQPLENPSRADYYVTDAKNTTEIIKELFA